MALPRKNSLSKVPTNNGSKQKIVIQNPYFNEQTKQSFKQYASRSIEKIENVPIKKLRSSSQ
jgi:predicted DNA-binding antitoxin AbrB/MazE fold protein